MEEFKLLHLNNYDVNLQWANTQVYKNMCGRKVQLELTVESCQLSLTSLYGVLEYLKAVYLYLCRKLKNCYGKRLSHLVEKPTMWFPTRSDTNQAVQSHKQARSLEFWS